MKQKILMCVTIDTECDKSLSWHNSEPLTFRSVEEAIPDLLTPIFQEYGVKPTYFLSPEVIEEESCQKVLKELTSAELGTHLHSDFIGPMKTIEDMAGYNADACQTDYPEEVEFQKLRNLTNLFSDVFEQKPRVFRAGRFSANLNTLKALHSLGYLVDSSFTPYCTWLTPKGNLIDHSQTPEEPYFPDLKNEDESSSPQLLEIPLTIVKRKIPLRQKVSWLRPVFSSPTAMKRIIRNKAASPPSKYPKVLNMMFHSEELVPCASPYTKNKADIDKYVSALKRVFDFAILKGCKFTSQEEIHKEYSSIYLNG